MTPKQRDTLVASMVLEGIDKDRAIDIVKTISQMDEIELTMKPYQYIVAGTYAEFTNFVTNSPSNIVYRYVSGPDSLLGTMNPVVKYVGSYFMRSDLEDIQLMEQQCQRD